MQTLYNISFFFPDKGKGWGRMHKPLCYTLVWHPNTLQRLLLFLCFWCWSHLGVIPHNLKSNTVNKLLRFAYRQVELGCFVSQCKFSSFIISTDPRFFWDCKCSLKGEVLGWSAFFIGIMSTSFGSAYYHLKPNDASLVWDRLPVSTIIFVFNYINSLVYYPCWTWLSKKLYC